MTERHYDAGDTAEAVEPIRLSGPGLNEDPSALYERIRQTYGPVAPVLLEGDLPAWFVCGYAELERVTADSRLFARDTRRWNAWDRVPDDWSLLAYVLYNTSVMFTEGPLHQRRSAAISDALADVDQFELVSRCERIADRLIDDFAGGGKADLIGQYAERIPLSAVAAIYGMPESETPGLVRDIAASMDSGGSESMHAYDRVRERMRMLVETKREHPSADVPSRLIAHPAGLEDEEIVLDLLVLLSTAHQPTANWIGNTIRLLLTDVRFAADLSGGRASVGQALNEVLWRDTPVQNFIGRVASRDTMLGGRRLHAGDLVVLGLAAANADPAVRAAGRDTAGNSAHLSFGQGEHGCPYPAPELAEVIARTSVEVLLDRLPDLALAVPPEALRWRDSVLLRGLTGLPVHFSPTHPTH
ncbi:cytochrome P450 [Saccharomonospora marina XMU15]|uniref:Cytochrome P450 n=1 Tax=Saccharomonospora marina XMU15 TaxID=882083 RepID=H5X6M1_9PSEU|nr:cytochrome P450 [Saccharomonospora marina]EHR51242.1 cytochrome P450 [Saccharomonospora marina XMU15]